VDADLKGIVEQVGDAYELYARSHPTNRDERCRVLADTVAVFWPALRSALSPQAAAPQAGAGDERTFPLQTHGKPGPLKIPWAVAEKAYGVYASRYGRAQTLERLAERGGFSWGEMDDMYPAWRDETDAIAALRSALSSAQARVAELEATIRANDSIDECPKCCAKFVLGVNGCPECRLAASEARGREMDAKHAALREAMLQQEPEDETAPYKTWAEIALDYSEEIQVRIAVESERDRERAARVEAERELSHVDAVLARRPALDKPTRTANIKHAIATAARADAAERERATLLEALTPSGATKAAYLGEFTFNVVDSIDEDGNERRQDVAVPWTTIKDIMAAIQKRAAAPPRPATAGQDESVRDGDGGEERANG
jgi:hypothetical protein